MAEYTRPQTEAEVAENFSPIKPRMTEQMAAVESNRCLFCYDAPCIQACPTGIDIPLFIRQIGTGNTLGAAKTIYAANALGNTCGKVCPTEVLCEGACVYNHQDVKPIDIGRLQNYATAKALERPDVLPPAPPPTGPKVAILGAGPAGISCAVGLRQQGYAVDVFEAKAEPSGLVLHGTAPYKITNAEALQEVAYLQKHYQFAIHYGRAMRTAADLKNLEADYAAIFLGIGLGRTRPLALAGEDLTHCIGATEFIEALKTKPQELHVGQQVVVLGGGNTAMDAASEAARMGAERVTLAYRRAQEAMGAYAFEYELAKGAGVQGLFGVSPEAIEGDTAVTGVRFVRTQVAEGRVVPIAGSAFTVPADQVILATGQEKQTDLLGQIAGLEWDAGGRIRVDAATCQTTNPHYFAGGDAVNGGAEVVNAVQEGQRAAQGIHHTLSTPNA